jgi:hypothetical protein
MPRTEYLAEAAAQFGHFLRLESDPLRLIFGFQPPDGVPENTDHPWQSQPALRARHQRHPGRDQDRRCAFLNQVPGRQRLAGQAQGGTIATPSMTNSSAEERPSIRIGGRCACSISWAFPAPSRASAT